MARASLSLLAAAVGALSASAAPTLTSSITHLNTTWATTTVTWSGVSNPSTSDWLTVTCLPSGTYYWW
jgi:hypothetical protein